MNRRKNERNRSRRPARNDRFRSPKEVWLIVCEGKRTEPEYLDGLIKHFRDRPNTPKLKYSRGAGDALQFVNATVNEKNKAEKLADTDENEMYDQVWAVFDLEDNPNEVKFNQAKEIANNNDICLAVSNPCIELWLYLHFNDSPGIVTNDDILARLKKSIPNYDKGIQFKDYQDSYADAIKRARSLDENAESDGEPGRNPSTGVWRLVQSIQDKADLPGTSD